MALERMTGSRWLKPFIELLRQGMSPEKLALTIALGFFLGTIPVLGSTTILCTVAALALRLNLPAIQIVNSFAYPFQLILLIPFYRMGASIFGSDASSISLSGVVSLIREGVLHAIETLWVVTIHAVVAWLVLGAVFAVALYSLLLPLMRWLWRRLQPDL
jgi:uncharacterized protein (DUF2062 family)